MNDIATPDAIVAAARQISLTTSVIHDWAQTGTPKQREYLLGYLVAEHSSRQHAKQIRLLKAAKLPVLKSLRRLRLVTGPLPLRTSALPSSPASSS